VNVTLTGQEKEIAAQNTAVSVPVAVKLAVDQTLTSVPHVQDKPRVVANLLALTVLALMAGPDVVVINGLENAINSVLDASAQQSGTVSNVLQTPQCPRATENVSVLITGAVTAVSLSYMTAIHLVVLTKPTRPAVSWTDKLVLMSVPVVMTDIISVMSTMDSVTLVTTTVQPVLHQMDPLTVHPAMMDSTCPLMT